MTTARSVLASGDPVGIIRVGIVELEDATSRSQSPNDCLGMIGMAISVGSNRDY